MHRPGRTKARLARIPMYEPDDDDLAAEEQARSLRVSPDSFTYKQTSFRPEPFLRSPPDLLRPRLPTGMGETLSG